MFHKKYLVIPESIPINFTYLIIILIIIQPIKPRLDKYDVVLGIIPINVTHLTFDYNFNFNFNQSLNSDSILLFPHI